MFIADHYERLGVAHNASRDQIRDAYRTLARRNHPDAKGEASASAMAEINEAWRGVLPPPPAVGVGNGGDQRGLAGALRSRSSRGVRRADPAFLREHGDARQTVDDEADGR